MSGVDNDRNRNADSISRYRRADDLIVSKQQQSDIASAAQNPLTLATSTGAKPVALGDVPVPDIPESNFVGSADGLELAMMSIVTKTADVMVQSAAADMKISTDRRNSAQAQREKDVAEMRRKNAEAAAKNNNPILKIFNKIFSGIGYVLGMAALGFATVLTLGATAPLLAAAVYGSGKQMAEGNFDFSMTKAMQLGVSDALIGMGVSADQAQNIAQVAVGVGMALTVMGLIVAPDAIGDMAGGAASLAGADETTAMAIQMAVTVATTIAVAIAMTVASGGTASAAMFAQLGARVGSMVMRGAEIAKSAYGVAQGGLSVANGAVGISVAINKRDASEFEAKIKETAALLVQLGQLDETNKELIETYMGVRSEILGIVSDMVRSMGFMGSNVSANTA